MISNRRQIRPRKIRRRRSSQEGQTRPAFRRFADLLADRTDAVIGWFAPGIAARRQANRVLLRSIELRQQLVEQVVAGKIKSAYTDAAANDRIRGAKWLASDLSPDAGLDEDIEALHRRADDLYRNNTIASGMIESRVSHEVGVGIRPQARVRQVPGAITKAEAARHNESIETALERWSSRGIDKNRRDSIGSMQRAAVRSYANYGEVFALIGMAAAPKGGFPMTVDLINPRRVETPPEFQGDDTVRLGIRYNRNNVVQGYYVRDSHPGDVEQLEFTYTYYPAKDESGQPRMLHVFEAIFPGQSRGFPWLMSAFPRLKDLDDYFEAELVAKQIEACFGLIFEQAEVEGATDAYDKATRETDDTDSEGNRLEEIVPGIVHYAEPGESVKTVDPDRPGSNFAPFIEQALRSIAASANYPYELVAKNFFRTTFSSGQLAMLDGRFGFNLRRQTIKERLLQPTYRRFVYELVFLGESTIDILAYDEAPWLYERHNWQEQAHGFINPRDEISSRVEARNERIMTEADIFAEQGKDHEEAAAQIESEESRRIEMEVRLRKLRWKLEEAAGLPHSEQQPAEAKAKNNDQSSQSKQDEREEAAA